MKHESALSKNGMVYYPKDIKDIDKLVEMRYYGLMDVNEQFELVAVNSKSNPYFRFKHSPGKDLTRIENNPSHTKVKDELLDMLLSSKSLRVYTNEFIEFVNENDELDTRKVETSLFYFDKNILSDYTWKTEVYRRIDKNQYTLFDICGYCKSIPFPTSTKPNVIFEIIVTSFPKSPVFKYLCNDSETNFTICIFIYVSENAVSRKDYNFYWNDIKKRDNELIIRVTQYIDQGFMFKNKKQLIASDDIYDLEQNAIRPTFANFDEQSEYWDKYYLRIKEKFFKDAVKKLK